jgi:hypothetical protein
MDASTNDDRPIQRRGRNRTGIPSSPPPPIICPLCGEPIVAGQQIDAVFSANVIKWVEHPVLSKPLVVRGVIF